MSIWVWTTEMSLVSMKGLQPSDIHDDVVSFSFGQVRFQIPFRWATLRGTNFVAV